MCLSPASALLCSRRKRDVAYVPQSDVLIPSLTVQVRWGQMWLSALGSFVTPHAAPMGAYWWLSGSCIIALGCSATLPARRRAIALRGATPASTAFTAPCQHCAHLRCRLRRTALHCTALHSPLLPAPSPQECLRYSALLRLPVDTQPVDLQFRIERVLEELGLQHVADSQVRESQHVDGL